MVTSQQLGKDQHIPDMESVGLVCLFVHAPITTGWLLQTTCNMNLYYIANAKIT